MTSAPSPAQDIAYVLVLNSGSSSIKFQILDPTAHATDEPLASGLVERIGEPTGSITIKSHGEKITEELPIPDHAAGLDRAVEILNTRGVGPTQLNIVAVGHRVVHGGSQFSAPALIDDATVESIRDIIPLAPLHNPAHISGIEEARRLLPEVPHVAVFDTAFFRTIPDAANHYAINKEVADEYGIRRYGFHGTSHEYVSQKVASFLDRPLEELNQITLHLGNGCSATAIKGGEAVDTSMGLTPLAGLVMGTRCGDIDPSIVFHLRRAGGMNVDDIDALLNRNSGLKGVSGVNDFRALQEAIDAGDEDAILAYDIYVHTLKRFIGSYLLVLGGVDTIAFTAGVGENHVGIRRDSLAGLEKLGIIIDEARNENMEGIDGARIISSDDSAVTVLVVPTNEELAIARYALEFVH